MNTEIKKELKVINMNQVSFSPRREFLEDSIQRLSAIYDLLISGFADDEDVGDILREILQFAFAYSSAEKIINSQDM